jgi:hypothetical protein
VLNTSHTHSSLLSRMRRIHNALPRMSTVKHFFGFVIAVMFLIFCGNCQVRLSRRVMVVPSFGPRLVCTGCGIVGADGRPNLP